MTPEANLIVRRVEAAVAGHQLGFVTALEPAASDHVENAVSAVAVLRRIAAALGFEVIDVFRIELRSDVARNVGIGHWNAIDEPTHLVAAAKVELVVNHDGAGHIIGDHGQTVGAVGARRA